MKNNLFYLITGIFIVLLILFLYLNSRGFFVQDELKESQKCKVYASPCCYDGYVCAESPPKCNLPEGYLCKKSVPFALTRVYCEYHKVSADYKKAGCYERPLYDGANCNEYCDYWKSQNCTSTFSESVLNAGWDPFDLEKWRQNCGEMTCECIKESKCVKEGEIVQNQSLRGYCCSSLTQVWDKNERIWYCSGNLTN